MNSKLSSKAKGPVFLAICRSTWSQTVTRLLLIRRVDWRHCREIDLRCSSESSRRESRPLERTEVVERRGRSRLATPATRSTSCPSCTRLTPQSAPKQLNPTFPNYHPRVLYLTEKSSHVTYRETRRRPRFILISYLTENLLTYWERRTGKRGTTHDEWWPARKSAVCEWHCVSTSRCISTD